MRKEISYRAGMWASMLLLAVILQSCPVFMGQIGYIFSILSTLPMVLTAAANPTAGIVLVLLGTGLLTVIEPQEAAIFFFMTAPLGIAIGAGVNYKKSVLFNAIVGGIVLSIGMMLCAYGIDIPIFGAAFAAMNWYATLPLMVLFALAYSWIWSYLVYWTDKRVIFFRTRM